MEALSILCLMLLLASFPIQTSPTIATGLPCHATTINTTTRTIHSRSGSIVIGALIERVGRDRAHRQPHVVGTQVLRGERRATQTLRRQQGGLCRGGWQVIIIAGGDSSG